MVVGGGKQALPDNLRLKLELLDERCFGNGMVYLYYHTRRMAMSVPAASASPFRNSFMGQDECHVPVLINSSERR
jgi:hypothetical protein